METERSSMTTWQVIAIPITIFQAQKILKKKKVKEERRSFFFTAFNLLFHDYNTLIDQLFGKSASKSLPRISFHYSIITLENWKHNCHPLGPTYLSCPVRTTQILWVLSRNLGHKVHFYFISNKQSTVKPENLPEINNPPISGNQYCRL